MITLIITFKSIYKFINIKDTIVETFINLKYSINKSTIEKVYKSAYKFFANFKDVSTGNFLNININKNIPDNITIIFINLIIKIVFDIIMSPPYLDILFRY